MANDICNSKCQMCLIWERKKEHEITPSELEQILSEPLFDNVDNVGVTGGEPTLRKDLSALFEVIASKPSMKSASMITNAIIEKKVKENVYAAAEICKRSNIGFHVMVSLDGLGEVHDVVRGRAGNFETAIDCLEDFQKAGISTNFGCTISKSNVYHVDALLDYAIENGIQGRFRIAEFIERLYNEPLTAHIRNFNEDERYHLGLFYSRLLMGYEKNTRIQKTYRSVRGMLVDGKPRTTGCSYHTDTVILTSRGELLYCSPKSPNLGSILEKGAASKVFFSNLSKRDAIKKNHCSDCIHDYHVNLTFQDRLKFYLRNKRIGRVYGLKKLLRKAKPIPDPTPLNSAEALSSQSVLIVGWYGTETAGDKAILWALIRRLRARKNPPKRILLSSFYPFVTRQTIREMELGNVEVVETWTKDFEAVCQSVDEVTIGGGPLMELRSLDHMLYAFIAARRREAITRIDSCGIGPLHDPFYKEVVSCLLRLANAIELRDEDSLNWAINAGHTHATSKFDPAVEFIDHCQSEGVPADTELAVKSNQPDLTCFLRDWPDKYRGDRTAEQFDEDYQTFNSGLMDIVLFLQAEMKAAAQLLPMHTFYEGGDDRIFGRKLARAVGIADPSAADPLVPEQHVTPWQIVSAMQSSCLCVCMRFHSVVFASTLSRPFIAIDYTNNGKIAAFLRARNQTDRLVSVQEVCDGSWKDRVGKIVASINET